MKKMLFALASVTAILVSCDSGAENDSSNSKAKEYQKGSSVEVDHIQNDHSELQEVNLKKLVDESSIREEISEQRKNALIFFGSEISIGTRKFETKYLIDSDISSILNKEYILYRRNLEDTTEFPNIELRTDVQPYFVIIGSDGARLKEFVGLPATKEQFIEFLQL